MLSLQLWMRIVGSLYLLMFVAVLARAPIRAEGPEGVVEQAAAGDPTARFVITTWITLGLLLGVLGGALLYFSGNPDAARSLAWTAIAVELVWGIPIDLFKIVRGQKKVPSVVWIGIHSVLGVVGLAALGVFS